MPALAIVLLVVALLAVVAWAALAFGGGSGSLADPGARGAASYGAAAIALLATAGMVATILVDNGNDNGERRAAPAETVTLTAREQRGGELFRRTCGNCHALAAAGTSGEVGPNLDLVQPAAGKVLQTIENGAVGYTATMPPRLLSGVDAGAVAVYVAKVARRFGDVPGGATRGPAR